MARITLIPPFANFHGKIKKPDEDQGLVAFSSQRAGNVARQWVLPTNPQSAQQVVTRGIFAAAATAFKSLTISEAADWNALGDLLAKTNILGIGYKLTGIAAYVMVNSLRQLHGQATSDVAPTFADIPIPILSITSVVYAASTLTIIANCTGITNGCIVLARITPSIARQSRQLRENELRIPDSTEADAFGVVGNNSVTIATGADNVALTATQYAGLQLTAMSAAYLPRAPWFIPQQLIS
jgi:hypothetical protein